MSELIPINWSDQEKSILIRDGAVIYRTVGETLFQQRQIGRRFWWQQTNYVIDGKYRLLDFPSRISEVAIYPDPERFFVSGTFNKSKRAQEAIIAKDACELRNRLGIGNLDEILPEASEVMEILFQHLEATLKETRLSGRDFSNRWIRTDTPISVGRLARIGFFGTTPQIRGWFTDRGLPDLGAVRWIVPRWYISLP